MTLKGLICRKTKTTIHIQQLFSASPRNFSTFWFSFTFTLRSYGLAKSTRWKVFFFFLLIISLVLLVSFLSLDFIFLSDKLGLSQRSRLSNHVMQKIMAINLGTPRIYWVIYWVTSNNDEFTSPRCRWKVRGTRRVWLILIDFFKETLEAMYSIWSGWELLASLCNEENSS